MTTVAGPLIAAGTGEIDPARSSPYTATTARPPHAVEIIACPECGLRAEIADRSTVASTTGPVDIIRTMCVQRHWFIGDADRLSGAAEPRLDTAP